MLGAIECITYYVSLCAVADYAQTSKSVKDEDPERHGSVASQSAIKPTEPSADGPANEEGAPNEQGVGVMENNPMMNMNGMQGQTGFGFPNQGNFNGMGWNGMNQMNGMTNMMGNGGYGMNPIGMSLARHCFWNSRLTLRQTLT